MQRVTIVRYTTKPGRAGENETLARAVFGELRSKPRQPFAYAVLRHGEEFLHLFLNLEADDADGLVELPSFKAFTATGEERWAAPPEVIRGGMRLLDVYGFEGATVSA
jgi:hypothetical protein